MPVNILCITHADFESPGIIESWAHEKAHTFTICRPYKGEQLVQHSNYDFLIVMGGPQSPLEIEKDPYLKDEIDLIKVAIQQDKPILGFCLGAQLIGEALGAKTARSPEKEVGVYPITLTTQGTEDPLFSSMPPTFPVIHWHNDMPGLTPEAEILAYSAGCPRQIVKYGPKLYGIQCHMEITLDGIKTMIGACPQDLAPSKYTQSMEELLSQNYDAINQTMITILNKFFSK